MFDQTTGVLEIEFQSDRDYNDPVRALQMTVRFTHDSGLSREVDAFWDGDRSWRVRFGAETPGTWRFVTRCSDEKNAGLHGQRGTIEVPAYTGENPLLRHGPVQLSENRRHLVHRDQTPFFWLADTAWNGVLKADPDDWQRYLQTRRRQGFTAVQAVLTQWRAFESDSEGEIAFSGKREIQINPAFYQRIDAKVAAITETGLVPALVLLWALTPRDPGHYLPVEDAILLARYEVARYGAYRPVWLLGGDGDYLGEHVERWRTIGRGVFDRPDRHLVTLHPRGQTWIGEAYRKEPWFDLIAYQSGHGDSEEALRWLVDGPPAQNWKREPVLPIINQEPNYEHHLSYHGRKPFDAADVRRALFWSLLISPTAGVTYGHHSIWPWMEEEGIPLDHERSGRTPPWHQGLESEGAASVRHLRDFFDTIEWWRLQPAPELLAEQPGETDVLRTVVVARTESGTLVAYTPAGDPIRLDGKSVHVTRARWYDPRMGKWTPAQIDQDGRYNPPSSSDWILLLSREN